MSSGAISPRCCRLRTRRMYMGFAIYVYGHIHTTTRKLWPYTYDQCDYIHATTRKLWSCIYIRPLASCGRIHTTTVTINTRPLASCGHVYTYDHLQAVAVYIRPLVLLQVASLTDKCRYKAGRRPGQRVAGVLRRDLAALLQVANPTYGRRYRGTSLIRNSPPP